MKIGRGDNALEVLISDGFNLSLDDIGEINYTGGGWWHNAGRAVIFDLKIAASAGAAMTYYRSNCGHKKGLIFLLGLGSRFA
ncbi:hypothetical protein J4734_02620 [Klebsiella pneumoniae]|uniref:Uncharacterized protein n=1 Tax=Klebsiella pneumoniae TaxID=573 RepID=A0A939NMH6_KLEPN|nr:hypothetical protein [Klebsiella pneumoniae]